MSPALEIEVDSEVHAPGGEVRGRVVVLEGGRSRRLEVRLDFRELVRGVRTAIALRGDPIVVHEGPLVVGARLPFTLLLPRDAPPSYYDEIGMLFWVVVARSDEAGRDTEAMAGLRVRKPLPPGWKYVEEGESESPGGDDRGGEGAVASVGAAGEPVRGAEPERRRRTLLWAWLATLLGAALVAGTIRLDLAFGSPPPDSEGDASTPTESMGVLVGIVGTVLLLGGLSEAVPRTRGLRRIGSGWWRLLAGAAGIALLRLAIVTDTFISGAVGLILIGIAIFWAKLTDDDGAAAE